MGFEVFALLLCIVLYAQDKMHLGGVLTNVMLLP